MKCLLGLTCVNFEIFPQESIWLHFEEHIALAELVGPLLRLPALKQTLMLERAEHDFSLEAAFKVCLQIVTKSAQLRRIKDFKQSVRPQYSR